MKYLKSPSNQFTKEYMLPIVASVVFIIMLIVMMSNRTINRIVLNDALGKNSNNDYAELLSSEPKPDFKNESAIHDDTTQNDEKINEPTNKPFTVAPSPAAPPPSIAPDAGPGNPAPTQPFFASILGVVLVGTQYEYCNSSNTTSTRCFKKYLYQAKIKTINGPGNVSFNWVGNYGEMNSTGNVSAPNAESYISVPKEFKLACPTRPESMFLKFIIYSPNYTESAQQDLMHECST